MSRIAKWLEEKREKEILEGIRKELEIIQKTIDNISLALENCIKGVLEECVRACMNVSMLENDSDTLRRKLLDQISRSSAPPDVKADTSRLVRRLDHVVDWAQAATRIMRVLASKGTLRKLETAHRKIMRMKEETANCVEALVACVRAFLERDFDAVLEKAELVEHVEERVDDLYASLREDFPEILAQVPVGEAILFVQLIDLLEAISDRCEDAVDQIRVLVVK